MKTPLLAALCASALLPAQAPELPLPQTQTGCSALLPRAIASFGAARAGNWIYVYGGHIGRRHRHSRDNVVGDLWRLNLCDLRTWEQLPGGTACQSVALVAHEGQLIRVGGMTAHNPAGEKADMESLREVRRFDPLRRRWSALPDLPAPRSSHDALVLGDQLYVVGGWSIRGDKRHFYDKAWRLDLKDPKTWEELAQPFQRRALVLGKRAGKLYALGGLNPKGETETRVDVFDPARGTWSRGPELPFRGFGVACADLGGELYANAWDRRVYRLGEDAWVPGRRLSQGRFFHRMVALDGGRILVIGGAGSAGHSRRVELVDLQHAGPRLTRFELPYAGDARNRQGVIYHQGRIHLFGGNKSLGQHDFEAEHFSSQSWVLNLADMSLRPGAGLPSARQSVEVHRPAGMQDGFLALAGFHHDGEVACTHGQVLRGRFRHRDFAVHSAGLPVGRTQFGLAEHEGELFVFGGTDYDPRRGRKAAFQYPLEVLSMDLAAEEPRFVDAGIKLRKPRRAFGAAQVGEDFYLFGGMGPDFALCADTEVFDLAARSWRRLGTESKPRLSPRAVARGGRVYLAGGRSPAPQPVAASAGSTRRRPKLVQNEGLDVFDPATGTFATLIERLPIPTRHLHMIAGEERQLIFVSTHHKGGGRLSLLIVDL